MLFDASVRLVSANCMSLWFVFLTTLVGKTKEQEIKGKKNQNLEIVYDLRS